MNASLPYRPCVGILLLNKNNLVFTAERIDMPGAWQMPQGGVDEGESLRKAALRELEEETNIPANSVTIEQQTADWIPYDLPEHLIGKVWGGRYRGQKQHWFKMRFNGPDELIDLETKHPEFSRWKWSSKEQLLAEIVDFKRSVYRIVTDELLP